MPLKSEPLDSLLDEWRAPAPSTALRERVLDAAPLLAASWRARIDWLTGLGLVGACAAGLVAGAWLGPPPVSDGSAALHLLTPEEVETGAAG